jgi:hypothetical protein
VKTDQKLVRGKSFFVRNVTNQVEAIMTTKRSRTNSPKTKELHTDKNRKTKKIINQFYIQGLGLFKILETYGEGNSFFLCLAM